MFLLKIYKKISDNFKELSIYFKGRVTERDLLCTDVFPKSLQQSGLGQDEKQIQEVHSDLTAMSRGVCVQAFSATLQTLGWDAGSEVKCFGINTALG